MMHGMGGPGGGMDRGALMRGTLDISFRDVSAKTIQRLWDIVRPHVSRLILATLLMFIASASSLAGPYLIKLAIDQYIAGADAAGLGRVSLVYVAMSLTNWVANYWQTYVVSLVGQSVIYNLRRRLYKHMLSLGLRFYDKNQAGRLMSRVTSDVDALNQLVSSGLTHLVNDVLTIVGIAAIMFYMDWRLALASFVTVPLLFMLVIHFQRRMTIAFHQVRRRVADVNAVLQESISGMKVIQAFSREESNMQIFEGTNSGTMQANMQAATLFAAFFPLVEIIGAAGTAAVVWYGGFQALTRGVSVGTLVAFLSYVTRFFWPIREISQVYNMFLAATVSVDRIFEVLEEKPEVSDKSTAADLPAVLGHVKLEDVTFGYEKDIPVLRHVNIEARPGQTIALVGPTGAGKTSIINLVSRFYDPWEGRVSVDGHDIKDVTLRSLKKQLGTVLQDTFIFSGTVAQNIRYARPDASMEQVVKAAKAVNAHDFIMRFPEGYDTEVHERGAKLSIGQRQLISFARAILADPRILILDEATSSVDAYTEVLIQQALETLLKGRTSIVIAHRLSTIQSADRIYVIDGGSVAESGTHAELLGSGGIYKHLYEKQFASPVV